MVCKLEEGADMLISVYCSRRMSRECARIDILEKTYRMDRVFLGVANVDS